MDKVKKWKFSFLLFISCCFSLSLSISAPVNAANYNANRVGIAVGLRDNNNSTERQRCYYNTSSTTCYMNTTSSPYSWTYIRFYFNAFNPANRDFSLSFIVGGGSVNDLGSLNVLGAYNLNVNVTPITNASFRNNSGATLDYVQAYFVNITGSIHQDYLGSSTDHLDVYYGPTTTDISLFTPSLIVSDDVDSINTEYYRDNVEAYLEDILAALGDLHVSGLIDAQEETTDAVNNPEYIQQEKQDLQNAKDDAEDSADDSQDDVDASTSSLLAVLTNFLGVLTSVTPSNCYLDGSLFPHLDLGQLNLCENSPPAAITALGSLLLIAFVIPLVYNTIKMMINLFSEFQR